VVAVHDADVLGDERDGGAEGRDVFGDDDP
jgi:hypothetical protein